MQQIMSFHQTKILQRYTKLCISTSIQRRVSIEQYTLYTYHTFNKADRGSFMPFTFEL